VQTIYLNPSSTQVLMRLLSCFRRGLNPPHRVKSISMMSFTPEEMDYLSCHGNDVSSNLRLLEASLAVSLWQPQGVVTVAL